LHVVITVVDGEMIIIIF